MMKFGARRGAAEFKKVRQSSALAGENIFVPLGQLFFCVDFETMRQCSHLIKFSAE
jgi:hypothetical protein